MNISTLDLLPMSEGSVRTMHPSDLCRLRPDFADIQGYAAIAVHNPSCVATNSGHLAVWPSSLARPLPVMVVYPPACLSGHVRALALEAPYCRTVDAADLRARDCVLSWVVGDVRLNVMLSFVERLLGSMATPPTHLAVVFVGRDEVSAQALALDDDFVDEVNECCRLLNEGHLRWEPDALPWLEAYRHRGPGYFYDEGLDEGAKATAQKCFFLEQHTLRSRSAS